MQILVLDNTFLDGPSGGRNRFLNIFKRMKGVEVTVLTSLLGKRFLKKEGLKARYLLTTCEKKRRSLILTYFLRTVFGVFKLFFIKKEWDIVYGQSEILPNVLPVLALKLKGKVRWVQPVHHIYGNWRERPGFWLRNLVSCKAQDLSLFLVRFFSDRVVASSLVKKELEKRGFDPEKVVVNSNGVAFSRLNSFPPAGEEFDAFYLGRVHPVKGVLDLPVVWEKVVEEKRGAKLGLIGKGERRFVEKLKQKIKKKGLEGKIEVFGFLEDKKAFSLLAGGKAFLFPSYEEGFGLAALEAQAVGLPVVAWNLPAYEDTFKKGMVKVKKGRTGEFSQKVIFLLENEEERRKLSRRARENAEKHDWRKISSREKEILFSVDN